MEEIMFYVVQYGMYLLYAIGGFILIKSLISQVLKQYHSNWNALIEDFNFSTQEFYQLLREELKNQVLRN